MENEMEMQSMAGGLPSIVIVGRPNVGKSSLFNAILKRKQAIVHFNSGVTRDRVASTGFAAGRRFSLVDTGGLGMYSGEKRGVGFWDKSIESQVETGIEEASVILFVVDAKDGLTPLDSEIAQRLRATGKPIVFVVNKVDDSADVHTSDDFTRLGFDKIFRVSCMHRKGIGAVLEYAFNYFPKQTPAEEQKRLKIAVLGRPNVGKSSLVNKLIGKDRVIVSDVAGTTRDSIDIDFTLQCGDETVPATLVDTAGLRKRSKVSDAVERYSTMRAEETLANCDIVLFMIVSDQMGATAQDKAIAGMIQDAGKPCVIVSNKWDACPGLKQRNVLEEIRYTVPFMNYAPAVFISAKTGYNFKELFQAVAEVRAQMNVKVSTAMVNRVVGDAMDKTAPPMIGPKPFKVYYGTMTANPPPTFTLFVNDPKLCSDTYQVYLEKYMRKAFGFEGMPLRLILKARARRDLVFSKNEQVVKKAGPHKGMVIKARKTTVYCKKHRKDENED